MNCKQAQKRLDKAKWQISACKNDRELLEHLRNCPHCSALARAEKDILADLEIVREALPEGEFSLSRVRKIADRSDTLPRFHEMERSFRKHGFIKPAMAMAFVVLVIISLIPFKYQEKVGYEISISGVDRNIAQDSHGIYPLLDALGMDKDKAMTLLDSIGKNEIDLKIGECSETCHLSISDLKTERDVQLIIKAIIDLGCCEIDNVLPIYRDRSTNLLRRATQKLFS